MLAPILLLLNQDPLLCRGLTPKRRYFPPVCAATLFLAANAVAAAVSKRSLSSQHFPSAGDKQVGTWYLVRGLAFLLATLPNLLISLRVSLSVTHQRLLQVKHLCLAKALHLALNCSAKPQQFSQTSPTMCHVGGGAVHVDWAGAKRLCAGGTGSVERNCSSTDRGQQRAVAGRNGHPSSSCPNQPRELLAATGHEADLISHAQSVLHVTC